MLRINVSSLSTALRGANSLRKGSPVYIEPRPRTGGGVNLMCTNGFGMVVWQDTTGGSVEKYKLLPSQEDVGRIYELSKLFSAANRRGDISIPAWESGGGLRLCWKPPGAKKPKELARLYQTTVLDFDQDWRSEFKGRLVSRRITHEFSFNRRILKKILEITGPAPDILVLEQKPKNPLLLVQEIRSGKVETVPNARIKSSRTPAIVIIGSCVPVVALLKPLRGQKADGDVDYIAGSQIEIAGPNRLRDIKERYRTICGLTPKPK